ncbi:MAG TPA: hypothetical protein VN028_03515 [Rhodocyclaceae bacterium]|nr:hypothetical protein [Rhodocyclaceae bacterium]
MSFLSNRNCIRRLLGLAALLAGLQAHAATLDLGCYQTADGAITVACAGDSVDPYFAARALLSARQAGLDIDAPARAWIAWLLPRQHVDGTFPRFCRIQDEWQPCARADADDASLALWIELLYAVSSCRDMPLAWRASAARANAKLQQLFDRNSGLYHVADDLPVGLLMDNVEIYAALRNVARHQRCMHGKAAAQRTLTGAVKLRVAIVRAFRPPGRTDFAVSTQPQSSTDFYPAAVAQIYPILFRMTPVSQRRKNFDAWMQAHGAQWLAQQHDHFPWGLVALAAAQVGDAASAACWRKNAVELRYGAHWNVLEEAAFQALPQDGAPSDACPQIFDGSGQPSPTSPDIQPQEDSSHE